MKLKQRGGPFFAIFTLVCGLICATTPSRGATTLFFDDFNGPNLNPIWQASLPDAHIGVISDMVTYQGAPNYGFETLDTNSVLRLTNVLSPLRRVGWSSMSNFTPADFHYEARFNTLTQGPTNSIDGFMEIWILDAANTNNYDIVSLFGGAYSSDRRFFAGSSIDNIYQSPSFNYQNDTYYRLALDAPPGQNIRASLHSDDGTELIGVTLNHGASAFPSGFKICLSQAVGIPYDPAPVDVAVDFVSLTSGGPAAPSILSQPVSQSVKVGDDVTFTVSAGGTLPLIYHWFFNETNSVDGATNSSLTLLNVQTNQAGEYSVQVSNTLGSAVSSNAVLTVNAYPPSITSQPADHSVIAGGTVTFRVMASGSPPLSYKWFFNATNEIGGATNDSLTLSDVQLNQAGEYSAQVTNPYGSTNSSNALLTVSDVPMAHSQTVTVLQNSAKAITLTGFDLDGDPLTYIVVNGPTNGALSGAAPNLTYQPATNFLGRDSFTFKVNDGNVDSATATVAISVVSSNLVLFFDDFNGPTLNPIWQASLPNAHIGVISQIVTYQGAPNYGFATLDSNSIIRLTNVLSPLHRVGWSSISNFTPADFHYEARFNTLTQGPTNSIDGFMEIWILDAANTNRYDMATLFGGGNSADPRFFAGSSIDNIYQSPSFSYQNNTYYRLVLDAPPGEHIRASLRSDDGAELIGITFAHGASAFSSGFKICLSQAVGIPFNPSPVDVAVDYVLLATSGPTSPSIISPPSSQTVVAGASVTFNVTAGGTQPLIYHWFFDETNALAGATNSSLTLTNVQFSQAGIYSVVVSNAYGSVTSSNAVLTVTVPPSALQVVSINATSGVVVLPINLISQGDENALEFSVNFNSSLLTFTGVSLGSGASGGSLLANTNQLGSGRLGLLLSLPAGASFAAGTREVVEISFFASPVTSTNVIGISFGDQPTVRQVSSPDPSILSATYTGGTITLPPLGVEGDVFPVSNGDGDVTAIDWVQMGRFVAGLDVITNASEFQRADCAPRSTLGDGKLTVADWVQAGRYAAGLDPLTAAGGPSQAQGGGHGNTTVYGKASPGSLSSRTLTASSAVTQGGHACPISIQLNSQGDENGLEFSLAYDPTVLSFASAGAGNGATGASLYVNASQTGTGKLGIVLALPTGSTFAAGTQEVVKVNFAVAPSAAGGSSIPLVTAPLPQQIASVTAASLPATYVNGALLIIPRNGGSLLNASHANGTLNLSWPASAAGFGVEASTDLKNWTPVSGTLVTNGANVTITAPAGAPRMFYRLQHP
jgi:hypothetical protein